MSAARVCTLAGVFAIIALSVVHLRAERVRVEARLTVLESEWIALRREQSVLSARAARLRAPTRLHDRMESIPIDLEPPGGQTLRPVTRLAAHRP